MKKIVSWMMVGALTAGMAACGPSTFLVAKGNRAYYFGRESKGIDEMVCKSGDLDRVLNRTEIPDHLKKDFSEYVCTDRRDARKVISLYAFLTPEEKKSLKRAFVYEGYMVNYVPC